MSAAAETWQPMKTAPRDGTVILLRWGNDRQSPGWWRAHVSPIQNADGTWERVGAGHPWSFVDVSSGRAFVNASVDTEYGPTHWTSYTAMAAASNRVRKLVGKLDQWRLCMSHNESYVGEPAGLFKETIRELASAVDPIYPPKVEPADPLSGVTIHVGAPMPYASHRTGANALPPRKIAMKHPFQSDADFRREADRVRGWNDCLNALAHSATDKVAGIDSKDVSADRVEGGAAGGGPGQGASC